MLIAGKNLIRIFRLPLKIPSLVADSDKFLLSVLYSSLMETGKRNDSVDESLLRCLRSH